ncbi:PorV/PorQ family protein, partial [bacterium]|nr:PorV/PorQ family protein [bacterium]
AVANDASAIYWNPAGMAKLERNEVLLNHTEWLADINYDFASMVIKLDDASAFGVSYTGLNMGDMEIRTILEPEGTGELFSVNDMSFGISYARNLTDRFSIGFNGKYIQQDIYHMSSSAFAVDIGTLFKTRLNGMTIGMSISNFGNKMTLSGKDALVKHDIDANIEGNNDRINAYLNTDSWSLPLTLRLGVAMDLLKTRISRLTVAADAMHPSDNLESMNVGFEYSLKEFLFIRGGYTNLFLEDGEETIAVGGGIHYSIRGFASLHFDYAYSDFGILNNVHRFSIGLSF